MKKFLLLGWIVSGILLFLYSFTQIDLSLTFSQVSVWQGIQKSFQYIGYFNRPLSTVLFVSLVVILFSLYLYTLNLIRKKQIERKTVWKIIIGVVVVLFFSYNAFSYDLFNYIFDAKILAFYNQNPYEHKALDYPGDPMLSFMHWTHRTYPYGPFWLVLTVPLYFVGFGFFSITFYLFKLLIAASFIGSVALVEKISKKLGDDGLFALAAFALNPFVLIESLVSSHNDIVMMFFGLLGLLMFLEKKYVKSLLFIILSIAIKYATALMIPALFARGIFKVSKDTFLYILIATMLIAVAFASYRTNFQPWYLLFVLPFAALIQRKYFIAVPVVVVSFFALMQYVPYLYLGNWDPPVPTYLNYILFGSVAGSLLVIAANLFFGGKRSE